MSEPERYGDGLCDDGAPEVIPPRASRSGRRSGVILPGQDNDTVLLEAVRAAPRRSSIIKERKEQNPVCVKKSHQNPS
ncbi:hypothetical protein DPEC_G00044760 [Dallia pectoralis]|uniref:Uncharacterized protein n=1 Tax=Dallia pectoralis TaxID=75939 RepID=A0ACC2HAD8_DALPE|nr:hypothetical protein DPEC_G00044760 [Dallia pectoralis]